MDRITILYFWFSSLILTKQHLTLCTESLHTSPRVYLVLCLHICLLLNSVLHTQCSHQRVQLPVRARLGLLAQDSSHVKLDICSVDTSQPVTLCYISSPPTLLWWDLALVSEIDLMRISVWSKTAARCCYIA